MANFKSVTLIFLLGLAACVEQQNTSAAYEQLTNPLNLVNSKQLDFSGVGDDKWTKFCVFGPYTNKGISTAALGFDWEVTQETDIMSNDGINVIVFATESKVIEYLAIPRNKINSFKNMPAPCIPRNNAVFTFEDTSYIYRSN